MDPPKRSFTILSVSRTELYCHELERRQNSDGPEINPLIYERSDTIEAIDAQLCRPGITTDIHDLGTWLCNPTGTSVATLSSSSSWKKIDLRQYLVPA